MTPTSAPTSASQMKKWMSESVALSLCDTLSYDTPHYDKWKKSFLECCEWNCGPATETLGEMEHELIGASFGCIFMITASELPNFKELLAAMLTKVSCVDCVFEASED